LFDELGEEIVAGAASGVFEVGLFAFGFGGYVFVSGVEGEMVFGRELGYEFFVVVGLLAAKLVIEVDYAEDDAEFFAEFEEQVEEGNGIGAAGDGDSDAVAGVEETGGANRG